MEQLPHAQAMIAAQSVFVAQAVISEVQLVVAHVVRQATAVDTDVVPPEPMAPPVALAPPVLAVLVLPPAPPVPALLPESLLPPHAIIEQATIEIVPRVLKVCMKSSKKVVIRARRSPDSSQRPGSFASSHCCH